MTGDEEVENEIEQADEFKDSLYAHMVRLESASSVSIMSMDSIVPAIFMPAPGSQISLPKLSIEPYDGEITKWTPFWDSYVSAIQKNAGLSDVNKFNYLR